LLSNSNKGEEDIAYQMKMNLVFILKNTMQGGIPSGPAELVSSGESKKKLLCVSQL